jgi:hypothetical protein
MPLSKMRIALGDSAEEPRYGDAEAAGYRLMVPVERPVLVGTAGKSARVRRLNSIRDWSPL